MFVLPKIFKNKEEVRKFLLELDKRIPNTTDIFMRSRNKIKAELSYVKLASLQMKNIPNSFFEDDDLGLLFVRVAVAVTYTKYILEEEFKRRCND